jgi:hypothetical protein
MERRAILVVHLYQSYIIPTPLDLCPPLSMILSLHDTLQDKKWLRKQHRNLTISKSTNISTFSTRIYTFYSRGPGIAYQLGTKDRNIDSRARGSRVKWYCMMLYVPIKLVFFSVRLLAFIIHIQILSSPVVRRGALQCGRGRMTMQLAPTGNSAVFYCTWCCFERGARHWYYSLVERIRRKKDMTASNEHVIMQITV